MAGIAPLFTTAPRIKLSITVGGDTVQVAYAIGLNLTCSVDVQPVMVLGRYGPSNLEPTMYNTVQGTMQILRLRTKSSLVQALQAAVDNASNKVSAIQQTIGDAQASSDQKAAANAQLPQAQAELGAAQESFDSNNPMAIGAGEMARHMSPAAVLLSQTFNVELQLKRPSTAGLGAFGSGEALSPNLLQEDAEGGYIETKNWMRIQHCRITSRNTNITSGQLVNEPLSFQGLLYTPMSNDSPDFKLDTYVTDDN